MINQTTITGINLELGDDFRRYANRKIGRLERLVPRQSRGSAHAEVRVREVNESHGNKYRIEATLFLPDKQLEATDSTLNMFAALDIVEEKLKNALRRYKDDHSVKRRIQGGGILGRFKRRRPAADAPFDQEAYDLPADTAEAINR